MLFVIIAFPTGKKPYLSPTCQSTAQCGYELTFDCVIKEDFNQRHQSPVSVELFGPRLFVN